MRDDCVTHTHLFNWYRAAVRRKHWCSSYKAARHLWPWCTSVEESWCRVDEHTLGHLIVGLQDRGNVFPVNTDRDPHKHVLGCFHQDTIEPLEVTLLQGLETKIAKVVVPLRDDVIPHTTRDARDFLRDDTSLGQLLHGDVEVIGAHLLDITGDDTGREDFIVWV